MPAPHHSVFTGRMPFLPPNQQCQRTEGTLRTNIYRHDASLRTNQGGRNFFVAIANLQVSGTDCYELDASYQRQSTKKECL